MIEPISKSQAQQSVQFLLNKKADSVIEYLNPHLNTGTRQFIYKVFINFDVFRVVKERYEKVGWKVKYSSDQRDGDFVTFE